MCFVNELDWYVEVCEETESTSGIDLCKECGCLILDGEWRMNIHMQEHEEPQNIDDDGNVNAGEEPDHGEEFEYTSCWSCWQARQAVIAHEISSGCDRHESQPSLGGLWQEIRDGGEGELEGYLKAITSDYPLHNPILRRERDRLKDEEYERSEFDLVVIGGESG